MHFNMVSPLISFCSKWNTIATHSFLIWKFYSLFPRSDFFVGSFSKPRRQRRRQRHETKGLKWSCKCILNLVPFLCRPLQNNHENGPRYAYFGERERTANRPFATNDHMVQNPPYWRASSLLFSHLNIREVKLDVYGKRQTAEIKLLQSVFSSLYSRIKIFVFAVKSKRHFSIFAKLAIARNIGTFGATVYGRMLSDDCTLSPY